VSAVASDLCCANQTVDIGLNGIYLSLGLRISFSTFMTFANLVLLTLLIKFL
jgi:hypothetical protein